MRSQWLPQTNNVLFRILGLSIDSHVANRGRPHDERASRCFHILDSSLARLHFDDHDWGTAGVSVTTWIHAAIDAARLLGSKLFIHGGRDRERIGHVARGRRNLSTKDALIELLNTGLVRVRNLKMTDAVH